MARLWFASTFESAPCDNAPSTIFYDALLFPRGSLQHNPGHKGFWHSHLPMIGSGQTADQPRNQIASTYWCCRTETLGNLLYNLVQQALLSTVPWLGQTGLMYLRTSPSSRFLGYLYTGHKVWKNRVSHMHILFAFPLLDPLSPNTLYTPS